MEFAVVLLRHGFSKLGSSSGVVVGHMKNVEMS